MSQRAAELVNEDPKARHPLAGRSIFFLKYAFKQQAQVAVGGKALQVRQQVEVCPLNSQAERRGLRGIHERVVLIEVG